jgi:uncharacterized protein (TIGR02466 family)
MQKTVTMLFPTPVAEIKNSDRGFFIPFAQSVLELMYSAEDSHLIETLGNWCSNDNLHNLDNFQDLKKYIDHEVSICLREIWKVDPADFAMTGMWSNVHKSFSKHHIHCHPNSFLSGVIYLEVADQDDELPGEIFFVDPRTNMRMQNPDYVEKSEISYSAWRYTPEIGKLLIFPSWLEHGTDPGSFKDNKLRISLSFNYTLLKSSDLTTKLNFKEGI